MPTLLKFIHTGDPFFRVYSYKGFDAFARYQEPLFRQQAIFQLDNERQELMGMVRRMLEEEKGVTGSSFQRLFDRLQEKFQGYVSQWRNRFQGVVSNTATLVGISVSGELEISYNLYGARVQDLIEERVRSISTELPAATYRALILSLDQGWKAGESREQLTQRVYRLYVKGYTRTTSAGKVRVLGLHARSALFAQTETTAVTNGAALAVVLDSGKEYGKEWVTQGDDKVRPEHEVLHGERRDLSSPFSNGLQYPGEPACRCTLLFFPKKK